MPNRLATESSPYLLQHAANPVDWFPWGADAFALARASDRPVLLSVGYAACHWCHVMAHESFEDETTARIMNERFVNVKVDREERPDVDSIHMQAVQAITGQGGWPMTVFLTPEGVPFYGGTYFPPEDRHGLPSFRRVLVSVSEAWRTRRDEVLQGAASLRDVYAAAEGPTGAGRPLDRMALGETLRGLRRWYDHVHGGFGGAPKFPQPMVLDALLRHWARTGDTECLRLVRHTWERMVAGGLHDQVGGGFHRYSVDAEWLVPHFEKMLYDQALLTRLAVHLWQATGDPATRAVADRSFGWLRRELRSPDGAWYASLDADSEGEEGRFYVWTRDELRALLGEDAAVVERCWGVTAGGNFEGANILHDAVGPGDAHEAAVLARARDALLAARAERVRPARDEKVLAGWNGLMLRTVAEAARVFGDAQLADEARTAGGFLAATLVRDGRALRSYAGGRARIAGFLEDHAALGLGFVALYELTADRAWLDRAVEMAGATVRWFWDAGAQAFFDTAHDAEPLITRPRDFTDNAIPSGTSLAVELQLLVAEYTGDDAARARAAHVLASVAEGMRRSPLAFGHLLGVADLAIHGATEVAIAGTAGTAAFEAMRQAASAAYVPSLVLVAGSGEAVRDLPLLQGRTAPPGGAVAYVCERYACDLPITEPDALRARLTRSRAPGPAPAPSA